MGVAFLGVVIALISALMLPNKASTQETLKLEAGFGQKKKTYSKNARKQSKRALLSRPEGFVAASESSPLEGGLQKGISSFLSRRRFAPLLVIGMNLFLRRAGAPGNLAFVLPAMTFSPVVQKGSIGDASTFSISRVIAKEADQVDNMWALTRFTTQRAARTLPTPVRRPAWQQPSSRAAVIPGKPPVWPSEAKHF
jgi:hypothetical protein